MRWFHGTGILNRGFRKLASRMKSSRFAGALPFSPSSRGTAISRPTLNFRDVALWKVRKMRCPTWNFPPALYCLTSTLSFDTSFPLSILPLLTPRGYSPLSFILITSRKGIITFRRPRSPVFCSTSENGIRRGESTAKRNAVREKSAWENIVLRRFFRMKCHNSRKSYTVASHGQAVEASRSGTNGLTGLCTYLRNSKQP